MADFLTEDAHHLEERLREFEAGVADVLEAYDYAEQQYAAVSTASLAGPQRTIYGTNTTQR